MDGIIGQLKYQLMHNISLQEESAVFPWPVMRYTSVICLVHNEILVKSEWEDETKRRTGTPPLTKKKKKKKKKPHTKNTHTKNPENLPQKQQQEKHPKNPNNNNQQKQQQQKNNNL